LNYKEEWFGLDIIRNQGTRNSSGMLSDISRTIKRCIGGLFSLILARLVYFTLAHPVFKASALALVCRYPALELWLYRFSTKRGLITGGTTVQIYSDFSRLTPRALRIYADLKAAVERHDKKG
jgi:hypothetical protein